MVERRKELNRRYHRKQKMSKLKTRLAAAKTPHDREVILKKIRILSPWWAEATPAGTSTMTAATPSTRASPEASLPVDRIRRSLRSCRYDAFRRGRARAPRRDGGEA